jgi:uncharacterized protein YjbI with pentapeptide repeats
VGITKIEKHERCTTHGCTGVKAPTLDVCFVHADDTGFARAFTEASRGGDVDLDLRGTPLTQAAVDRILRACPTGVGGTRLLQNVDARAARPTEPLKVAAASFNRLHVDEIKSEHEVSLDLTVHSYMSMFDISCAGLDIRLHGAGKVICDRLQAGDMFTLWLGEYTASFRAVPLYARHIFIHLTADSSNAEVLVAPFGDDCNVTGGTLGRLEVRDAQLQRELDIIGVDVEAGIWLTNTAVPDLHLAHCKSAGIDLDGVRVAGDLRAEHLELGSVWARGCRIAGEMVFRHVTANSLITGRDAYFGLMDLAGCSIAALEVTDTTFVHLALDNAEIARASLSSIVVEGHASLRAAKLAGPLLIADAELAGSLTLNGVAAAQDVTLRGVHLVDALGIFRARVKWNLYLTDVTGARIVDLRELRVDGAADLDGSADEVDMSNSTIVGALRLRAQASLVRLVATTLMSRGEVECYGASDHICALHLRAVEPRERLLIAGRDRTSVVDLRRARCDGIRLQAVALDRCLFDAATGLEEMRLTGESFARRARKPARGRVVLAEDPDFDRDLLPSRADKLAPEADAVLEQRRETSASQMAQRYRSLRKGLEDSKDSAGASEFYFAEMQMRRADPGASAFERALLWTYRVFGGYGVRPLAPAVWLAILLVVGAAGTTALGAVNRFSTPAQRIELAQQDCRLRVDRQGVRVRCPASTGTVNTPPTETERSFGQVILIVASSTFGFTRALGACQRSGVSSGGFKTMW